MEGKADSGKMREVQEAVHRQAFAAYEEAKQIGGLLEERFDEQIQAIEGRKKLFSETPCIVGERIVLDRVVDTDAGALSDLIENPLVQRYLPTFLFEKQFKDVREAIRQLYGDLFANKESLIMAVRLKETGELVGLAEFYGFSDRLHKVSVGVRFRERWWGQGLSTEATSLMVNYLHDETDVKIITASTRVENKAAAHALEKVGFICTAHDVEEDWGFPEPTIVNKWFRLGEPVQKYVF